MDDLKKKAYLHGYSHGRADGVDYTLKNIEQERSESRQETDDYYTRGRELSRDRDQYYERECENQEYAWDMRRAMEESRSMARSTYSEYQTQGAGSSRQRPPTSRPPTTRPPSPQPQPRRAPTEKRMPDNIEMRAEESAQWPDAEMLGNQAIAALPLPTTVKVIKINPSMIRLDTKDAAQKPAEATTYNQLWPHLATKQGLISDVFTRLHAAIPHQITASTMRAAVMGFAVTHQILTATNWDRHQLTAFIIVLGTLRRNHQITPQIWERILLDDDMHARQSGANAPSPKCMGTPPKVWNAQK